MIRQSLLVLLCVAQLFSSVSPAFAALHVAEVPTTQPGAKALPGAPTLGLPTEIPTLTPVPGLDSVVAPKTTTVDQAGPAANEATAVPAVPAEPAATAAEPAAAEPKTLLGRLAEAGRALIGAPTEAKATLDGSFDKSGKTEKPTAEAVAAEGLRQSTQALFRLRRDVRHDAYMTLMEHMGGQNGDDVLYQDVRRVLDRLLAAQGRPAESAQLFIGNSFLPNAFTSLADSEREYLAKNARLAKAFRVSNTFISLGLLRSVKNETELAFVLAHELSHNAKGHLKDFTGGASHMMLGHFHEFEADAEALKLIAAAGYDPRRGMDTLYSLDEEMERLEKRYALVKRKQDDVAEAINRLRDVHPHSDLRRASMLEHLNEALELYKPAPSPEKPIWMHQREAAVHLARIDRFEIRVNKAIDAEPDTRKALFALERFQSEAHHLSFEHVAVIEEAYRKIARRTREDLDISMLQVSTTRRAVNSFPSRKLKAGLTTRRLTLAFAALPEEPTLKQYFLSSGLLSKNDRAAGALRILGAMRGRPALESAYDVLAYNAEILGLTLDNEKQRRIAAAKIWRGVRGVLSQELGRPALPEEIIDELRAKLPSSFLDKLRLVFPVEILDSAFGPEQFRSKAFAPSALVARLYGEKKYDPEAYWNRGYYYGRSDWSARHYKAPSVTEEKGKAKVEYERYYLDGLTQPSLRDSLDFVNWFTMVEGHYAPDSPQLTPAFLRLLRRDGGFLPFLDAFFSRRVAKLQEWLKGASTHEQRDKLLGHFAQNVNSMLNSALYEAKDVDSVRVVVEAAWTPIENALATPELTGGSSEASRSQLIDGFLQTTAEALRRAVVSTDMAGRAPDREAILKMAALIKRMESKLRAHSAGAIVRAHAANLAANFKDDGTYIDAYGRALDRLVSERENPIWERLKRVFSYNFVNNIQWFFQKLAAMLARLNPYGRKPLPGIDPGAERLLSHLDFTHFLAAIGDKTIEPRVKLMYVALLDRVDANQDHGKDDLGRNVGLRGAAAVGRWLLQDLAAEAQDAASLRKLSDDLLLLYDRHPALLQPDFAERGTRKNAFRPGAQYIQRSETYLSIGRGEHPFRGVSTRWAVDLFKRLDASNAWPSEFERKLDLLDVLNSTGEFSELIDDRIVSVAQSDPEAFSRWIAHDTARAKRFYKGGDNKPVTVKLPMGQSLPLPVTQPLRIVRNPNLRAKLFDLLPEAKMGENQPWRGLKETWQNGVALLKAYREARKFFSYEFLNSLRREESLENKFFDVLEEIDKLASERAAEAATRWEEGNFKKEEEAWLAKVLKVTDPLPRWKQALPHDREAIVQAFKRQIKDDAMGALIKLYNAFTNTQDPVLAVILHSYPEPTRSRDELLERLIKARRLRSGALTILESNKSYRMPNPVRVAEKQMLDQAAIQMRKFTPSERVDLLLHIAKVERLSPETMRRFNHRLINEDRRKLMREFAGIRNIAQLEDYLSLMHRKDRALMVKSMFYGENALGADVEQSKRLYERLVIENRDLPEFMQKLLRAYFKILTPDERAQLISDIAAIDDVGSDLKGPEIMKVALKNGGVTGAKIAQVLSNHRGIIPEKYADYLKDLEGFKEKAQDMEKMRAHDLISARIDALVHRAKPEAPYTEAQLKEIGLQALPVEDKDYSIGEKSVSRQRIVEQVQFLLADQRGTVESIEAMGPELGAGSIKLVYKVKLDDGRIWVAKIRAPGAAYKSTREFQIIEDLISELEKSGDLDLPGIRQLVDEVRSLVLAEMNFKDERAKEEAMIARVAARPWYAWFVTARPYIPRPHQVYISEDLMIEEFVPTKRFSDLPLRSFFGPSKRRIAAAAISEGMFDLVYGEWLEPDPHTGNRHARSGWFYRLWSKLVVMDLGQGVKQPIDTLKPLMKAGVAAEVGDADGAAEHLLSLVTIPPGETTESIRAAIRDGVARARPGDGRDGGVLEALTEGLLEAEKKSAIVKAQYAALQKAFLIYASYSPYLPRDYAFERLQRAGAMRVLRDRPVPLSTLIKLGLKRLFYGPKAVRAEMEALIDTM